MFTGIIESLGKVQTVDTSGTNKTFWISSPLSHDLKIDQSISHSGVCLTVEEIKIREAAHPAGSPGSDGPPGSPHPTGSNAWHRVTAIEETLNKTNLGIWQPGSSSTWKDV